jgi:hypothetical protein
VSHKRHTDRADGCVSVLEDAELGHCHVAPVCTMATGIAALDRKSAGQSCD